MKTREVANVCGVTEECIRQNAKKIGIVMEHGKPHDWSEDELKKVQLELMKNQVTQGVSTLGGVVESNTQIDLGLGALTIAATQSVEATQQLCNVLMQKAQQFEALQLEQQKNQLLIEQNEVLQKEVDKYVNWKSAKEIKLEFKLPARPGIEKVALMLKLRENEDWITRSYDGVHFYKKILYSPEAAERIVEYIKGE